MTRSWLHKRLPAAGAESGLTIIEVLVAAVVLVLGAAATFGVLASATRNAQRAKAGQVVLDLAQEELERLHSLPYENLALEYLPQPSASALNPNSRVSGSQFNVKRNGSTEYEPLVVAAGEGFNPESSFTVGNLEKGGITGTIYRYVVWRNDPSCPAEQCPGSEDFKQIIVAVKPDRSVSQPGEPGYVEVQSDLTNPEAVLREGEPGGDNSNSGSSATAQQFYLTDTPCAASGTTSRVEPTEDHLLHNTLGTCANGLKTGNKEPGAPDVLSLSVPPDPAPTNEAVPALHDYSDDFYLEPTPDTDKGVQIRRDDTTGCHFDPTGTTNPESQVHRWVTDKMTSNFQMSGRVTLEFYTRTLNDAIYTGALCVYLFDRSEAGSPATDTHLINKATGSDYWLYVPEGNAYWPRNLWTKVRLTMELKEAKTIATGERLGLGLSVEREGTQAEAIPIMYDHPKYPSRLEVDTSTPIEGG